MSRCDMQVPGNKTSELCITDLYRTASRPVSDAISTSCYSGYYAGIEKPLPAHAPAALFAMSQLKYLREAQMLDSAGD
jgi:hypothetical protein